MVVLVGSGGGGGWWLLWWWLLLLLLLAAIAKEVLVAKVSNGLLVTSWPVPFAARAEKRE